MTGFDAHADLTAEFAFLRGVLDSSGPWARAVLADAACESPWFVTQVADLAPAPGPGAYVGLAAGLVISLPIAGPLSAHAGEFTEAVRHVLGHQTQEGSLFDFGNGEAVWADDGKAVTRTQLRALNRPDRREFYASMGLAEPAPVAAETLTLAAAQVSETRIRVVRDDGRGAPVLAEVREKVAMLRAQRQSEYLAYGETPVRQNAGPAAAANFAPAYATDAAPAPAARPATLYDAIWAQVGAERQAAKQYGFVPKETALAPAPGNAPSLYQAIWAEVQAERAAARGDGILGTMASQPAPAQGAPGDTASAIAGPAANPPSPAALPDLVDIPRAGDVADIPAVPEMADVSPLRDLIDASAAILDRS